VPEGRDSLYENITIYPNPTTGELEIRNYESEIKSIEVFDVYGRKVSSHHLIPSSSNHLINISHLTSGIYFVKVTTEQGEVVKKVIKQ
ncbi:MAG: T9SS type A sorting domain-containing protein, partial [Lentimicrobiaceae bacterium]|nr:T9SS type A sorting domain-containing protein [Lentimicrobiaceae bacterium]